MLLPLLHVFVHQSRSHQLPRQRVRTRLQRRDEELLRLAEAVQQRDHEVFFADRSADRVELFRQCLQLVDVCWSTSSPSSIIVVKKRRRRKSLFARLFFSKCSSSFDHASCAPLDERTNGSCESSDARQMIAIALRDFFRYTAWSLSVWQCSSLTSPLTTSHSYRVHPSTICILNFHVWRLVPCAEEVACRFGCKMQSCVLGPSLAKTYLLLGQSSSRIFDNTPTRRHLGFRVCLEGTRLLCTDRLRHHVYDHLFGRTVFQHDLTVFDFSAHKVVADVDVLGALVQLGFFASAMEPWLSSYIFTGRSLECSPSSHKSAFSQTAS